MISPPPPSTHPPSFIIEKMKPYSGLFLICNLHLSLCATYFTTKLLSRGIKPYWMLTILFSLTILGVELFFPLWWFFHELVLYSHIVWYEMICEQDRPINFLLGLCYDVYSIHAITSRLIIWIWVILLLHTNLWTLGLVGPSLTHEPTQSPRHVHMVLCD